jgi:type I restriction enzyme S subunit
MKFTKYDSYKGSGVEWLGEIPEDWEVNHLKRFLNKVTDGAHTSSDTSSSDFPFLSVVDLKNSKLFFERCLYTSKEDYLQLVKNGCQPEINDILFSKDGTIAETTVIEEKRQFVVASSLIIIKSIIKKIFPKYLSYFLSSKFNKDKSYSSLKGAGLTRISIGNVKRLFFVSPSKTEQIKISNFLDKKTSQIDRKIQLLQEKKESHEELKKTLINETVCRGLNKDAELKDSGIEWIGKIPKHWKLVRLKDVSKNIFAGGTPSTRIESYWDKKEIIWLPSGELQNNIIYKHLKNKYISFKGFTNSATKMIKPNTTLIALTGATCANVGYLTFQACANQSVVAITNSTEFVSKYLFYYLLSKRNYIETYKTGGAQAGINTNDVKYIIFPKSPKEEQIQIANYLDEKTSKIDKIVLKINDQIETLKEFRKTLINDVVTGKVRIQDE